MHCLHFCKAVDGWWQEQHKWLIFIVKHMWNPQCKNFLFPQAVGEDVNTCWGDSDFCSNCCAWNTMHKFDRFHVFHVAFVHCWCWGTTVRGITCLFLTIFNGIHPLVNRIIWSIVSLNLSSTICNTLEHFYPTKHEILLMFTYLSVRNFL